MSFVGRVDDPTSRIMFLGSCRRSATRKCLQLIYQFFLHLMTKQYTRVGDFNRFAPAGMIPYVQEKRSRPLLGMGIAIIGTAQVENLLSPLFLVVSLVAFFFNVVKMC